MSIGERNETCEQFNRLQWHDSKLRSLRILHNNDVDEVHLEVELRGMDEEEFTPITVVLEDALFFICDVDLQGKRECSDDISSATCEAESELLNKLQMERLNSSPNSFTGYFHFQIYLIPPGGTLDIIASRFRLERKEASTRQIGAG